MQIAIVGGGASGALALLHIMNTIIEPVSIKVFEPGILGQGQAYSTPFLHHILNVPASNMSAFPNDPDDFVSWLLKNKPDYAENQFSLPKAFVSRKWYGEYLADTIANHLENKPHISFEKIDETVTQLSKLDDRYVLKTDKTTHPFEADIVILALGNPKPDNSQKLSIDSASEQRYIGNPWQYELVNDIAQQDTVIIQGLGLTMADMVLSLENNHFKGKVIAYSRSGKLPLPHLKQPKGQIEFEPLPETPVSLKFLIKFIRHQCNAVINKGGAWQDVVDTYKKDYSRYWQQLTTVEQKRFLRHMNSLWNIHRHRLPCHVLEKIQSWQESGQLTVVKGHLVSGSITNHHVSIQVGENQLQGDYFIDCSGPSYRYPNSSDSLIQSLLTQNLASSSDVNQGFKVTEIGELLSDNQELTKNIYAIGPPTKGQLWETTSIPTIRLQTSKIADRVSSMILSELA